MQEEKTEIERCDFIHVHEDVVKKVFASSGRWPRARCACAIWQRR